MHVVEQISILVSLNNVQGLIYTQTNKLIQNLKSNEKLEKETKFLPPRFAYRQTVIPIMVFHLPTKIVQD